MFDELRAKWRANSFVKRLDKAIKANESEPFTTGRKDHLRPLQDDLAKLFPEQRMPLIVERLAIVNAYTFNAHEGYQARGASAVIHHLIEQAPPEKRAELVIKQIDNDAALIKAGKAGYGMELGGNIRLVPENARGPIAEKILDTAFGIDPHYMPDGIFLTTAALALNGTPGAHEIAVRKNLPKTIEGMTTRAVKYAQDEIAHLLDDPSIGRAESVLKIAARLINAANLTTDDFPHKTIDVSPPAEDVGTTLVFSSLTNKKSGMVAFRHPGHFALEVAPVLEASDAMSKIPSDLPNGAPRQASHPHAPFVARATSAKPSGMTPP